MKNVLPFVKPLKSPSKESHPLSHLKGEAVSLEEVMTRNAAKTEKSRDERTKLNEEVLKNYGLLRGKTPAEK